jgi:LacI family transcriptional regulator
MKPPVLLILQARFEECASLLKGIMHYQRSHRPWAVSLDDEARAESDPEWLRRGKWQGVISRHTTPTLIATCAQLHIPLVDLNDTPPEPGISKIRPDNVAIGHLGAEHFLERRYRHFGFCGFSNHSWSRERRDGFLEALGLAGHSSEVFEVEYDGDLTPPWDVREGRALTTWLRRLPGDTGVMACNDLRAVQVVQTAQAAGLDVPEKLAVLGVNNDAMRCELSDPPISSVAPNAFLAGEQAARQLERLMEGGIVNIPDLRIEPVGVIARKSTEVLALRDKNAAVALNYIREHACEGITVDDVLGQVFVSRSQLEHKFRRFIGRSPQVEIRRVQVARISQLLADTNMPLKEIADLAGFSHVEYMSVVFKRLTGETPGHYRRTVQAREPTRAIA